MTTATKTPIKTAALDAAWEAHQSQERRAFEERFAAEAAAQKEQAAQEAAAAAEHDKLVAAREAADKRLGEVLRGAETDLQVFTGVLQAALIASDEWYNAGVALGYHGRSDATRDTITARVNHVLNLAGFRDFDISLSPSGRNPLGQPAEPYKSNMVDRPPLPNRRELHDVSEGYPGQNPMSRPVIKTELQKADGTWVDMPIGSYDWPDSVEP